MRVNENLYMIEEVNADENVLVLADYIHDKKVTCLIPDNRLRFYESSFDDAIENNMFIFVVYNEENKKIVV